jgi:signal transduction histidine kinase
MLNGSTSPLPNQKRGNEHSISSKIVLRSAVARKLPETSQVRSQSQPRCEQCDRFNNPTNIDTDVRRDTRDMTLLGTAVHDLRHPAGAILISSELLAEALGPAVSQEQGALIDSIHSICQFMLRLLDDILDLACSHPGTVQLRATPSSVAGILAQSLAISRPLAARRKMRLDLIEEGEPQLVLLNKIQISKVFNNLIENAVKYCQPGARIQIRISHSSDNVLVSVQDDGPGISHSEMNTLFTPFQRTLARALSDQQGTGLGLAIAKHIVDLHGGQIHVESQVGKGTTFYVSLPTQAGHTPKKS